MFEIIKRLFDICLFKKGPQDLPPYTIFLYLVIAANVVISFMLLHMGNGFLKSLLQAATGLGLELAFCGIALMAIGKLARFTQTASALLGVDTLITFFALPVMATMYTGQGGVVVFLLMVGLIIWHWAIIGHIMRHALGQHISFGLGLALLYMVASYKIMALLFPELPDVVN